MCGHDEIDALAGLSLGLCFDILVKKFIREIEGERFLPDERFTSNQESDL